MVIIMLLSLWTKLLSIHMISLFYIVPAITFGENDAVQVNHVSQSIISPKTETWIPKQFRDQLVQADLIKSK